MISKILHSAIENNNGKIVVLSIQKKWLDKIKSGKKTLEIRKSSPWDLQYPFAVMCYETKKEGGCGKIAAAFVCNEIETLHCFEDLAYTATGDEIPAVTKRFCEQGCMSQKELYDYGRTAGRLYGWHVSNIELFDAELREMGVRRAPQSWQYGKLRYNREYIIICGDNNIGFSRRHYRFRGNIGFVLYPILPVL